MQWNKKMLSLVATSLVAFTSIVNAEGDTAQMRNLENRVSALEQRKGASGMINPQGRPQVRNGYDVFLFGDVLAWNAHENGLNVGVKNKGSAVNLSNSKTKTVHGKWNAGFRAGIGYNSMHDGWDFRLTWLRFTDKGRKNSSSHSSQFIFPTLVHPGEILGPARTMTSHWRLRLNQIDLDMGREFFVSKWLTLRPHFGVRTDWIRQKLHAHYHGFTSPLTSNVKAKLNDHWWGIGLEGGLDTQWGLGSGWSVFGNITGAIVYGFHHIKDETQDKPTNVKFVNLRESYRVSQPILDLQMGFRWDNMFCDDRYHLGLQVGWEHHVYFSQNQFPFFTDDVSLGSYVANQGDLTLQGWTFGARFDF